MTWSQKRLSKYRILPQRIPQFQLAPRLQLFWNHSIWKLRRIIHHSQFFVSFQLQVLSCRYITSHILKFLQFIHKTTHRHGVSKKNLQYHIYGLFQSILDSLLREKDLMISATTIFASTYVSSWCTMVASKCLSSYEQVAFNMVSDDKLTTTFMWWILTFSQ